MGFYGIAIPQSPALNMVGPLGIVKPLANNNSRGLAPSKTGQSGFVIPGVSPYDGLGNDC